MVYSMYDDDFYNATDEPKTLSEWVKNFRLKKLQMKRRLRAGNSNLRVCAILSTALLSAEHQLRAKQQERLNRCLQLQSKFHEKLIGSYPVQQQQARRETTADFQHDHAQSDESHLQQQQHHHYHHQQQQEQPHKPYVYSATSNCKSQDLGEAEIKRRIEISNLWREELNGLDNLLRKTSSSSSSYNNNNNNNNSALGGGISASYGSVVVSGSCAEAANQRYFDSDEKNMLQSIAVLS